MTWEYLPQHGSLKVECKDCNFTQNAQTSSAGNATSTGTILSKRITQEGYSAGSLAGGIIGGAIGGILFGGAVALLLFKRR